jgi:hypothetical protein
MSDILDRHSWSVGAIAAQAKIGCPKVATTKLTVWGYV